MTTEIKETDTLEELGNKVSSDISKEYTTVFGDRVTIASNSEMPCTTILQKTLTHATLIPMKVVPATVEDFKPINQMIEDALDVDENENGVGLTLLPIDAVKDNSFLALVVEDTLEGYLVGFHKLTDISMCGQAGIDHILHILIDELSVLISFQNHGYILKSWNSEQFYSDVANQMFRFVCLPQSPTKVQKCEDTQISVMEKCFASHLLYTLIGAYPIINGKRYDPNESATLTDEETECIELISEDQVITQNVMVKEQWDLLPLQLRKAIIQSLQDCIIGFENWRLLLSNLLSETQECISCKRKTFHGVSNCLFCGHSLDVSQLSVKLQVNDTSNKTSFALIFRRGTVIYGCTLSPKLPATPFMQLMYNPSKNQLYLKNISGVSWKVSIASKTGIVKNKTAIPISSNITIQIKNLKSLILKCEGVVE